MTTSTRIYRVNTETGSRLVRASNRAQALAHVARDTLKADVASQDDLVTLTAQQVQVETAGTESAN